MERREGWKKGREGPQQRGERKEEGVEVFQLGTAVLSGSSGTERWEGAVWDGGCGESRYSSLMLQINHPYGVCLSRTQGSITLFLLQGWVFLLVRRCSWVTILMVFSSMILVLPEGSSPKLGNAAVQKEGRRAAISALKHEGSRAGEVGAAPAAFCGRMGSWHGGKSPVLNLTHSAGSLTRTAGG